MQLIHTTGAKQQENKAVAKNVSKKKNIKAALTLATTALLGVSQITSANTQEEDEWSFDTAFLFYSEVDRVSAAEGIINAQKTFDGEKILNLKLTVDALTGASANGAVAQPTVQTFTRPSGNGQYQVKAGDTPLDDTFHDSRVQFNAQWTQPIAPNYTASVGGHFSKEYDYLSLGVNGNLAYDFNKKNSTFSFGLSYFQDTFTPEGGIPKPLATMLIGDSSLPSWDNDFAATRLTDSDDKTTSDILLGFTQVINRRMIMQFNYSYSMVDGYLTDPFKVISVVNSNGETQENIYENRPDQRTKQSAFVQAKYHFDTIIADVSYRYMWDDWEIDSHTIDSRFRVPLGGSTFIEPHLRVYQQSAADFYQPFLKESEAMPEFASADYRIGEMTALTVGVKYGMEINQGNELSFRLEYYRQTPTSAGHDEPGVLSEVDLYPTIDAIIGQVTYSF